LPHVLATMPPQPVSSGIGVEPGWHWCEPLHTGSRRVPWQVAGSVHIDGWPYAVGEQSVGAAQQSTPVEPAQQNPLPQ